jgi:hypothetical protein
MVSRMQPAHSVDGQSMQQHVLNVERLTFPRVASMPSGSLLTILKLISRVGAGFQQRDFALFLHIQYIHVPVAEAGSRVPSVHQRLVRYIDDVQ